MSNEIKKRGLGRGLDALFSDARKEEAAFEPKYEANKIKRADEIVAAAMQEQQQSTQQSGGNSPRKLPIDRLRPGKYQPRQKFDEASIDQLAESITMHGIIQPLLVRPVGAGNYEIIAGERRWRAAQKAQIHEVPVVIQDMDDRVALEIGLIENLQREDLTPLEEAEGYQRLMEEFHHSQEVLAQHIGKSRSHVTNTLRLLKLSSRVRRMIQEGQLSAGHARVLVGAVNADEIADAVIKRGLSVRQTEKLLKDGVAKKATTGQGVRSAASVKKPANKNFLWKDVDVLALEEKMSSLLGMKVTIDSVGVEGTLRVEYKSLEQLDDVLERLSHAPHR